MELGVVLFTAGTFFAGGFVLGTIRERNRLEWYIEYDPEPDPIPLPEQEIEDEPRLRLVA